MKEDTAKGVFRRRLTAPDQSRQTLWSGGPVYTGAGNGHEHAGRANPGGKTTNGVDRDQGKPPLANWAPTLHGSAARETIISKLFIGITISAGYIMNWGFWENAKKREFVLWGKGKK